MAPSPSKKLKPKKPFPSFPLTPHANGQWCKKIRGKVHFFGVWADPSASQEEYNRQAADLHAGRQPKPRAGEGIPTVKDLGNAYLAAQQEKAIRSLITPGHFNDCLKIVQDFVRYIGRERRWDDLKPADFGKYRMSLYDRYGVSVIERAITIVRAAAKFAYETDLIDRPMKYGGQFSKPSMKERRQRRSERDRDNGKRLFEPRQLRLMLKRATGQLRAMILLAINGGFGNTDCSELPVAALNWRKRIIDYERRKTAVQRVVPLWPETVVALQEVLNGARPKPRKPEYEGLVFLTLFGNPWKVEVIQSEQPDKPLRIKRQQAISLEFSKLLTHLGFKRPGLGFYALRHTFRTWADEVNDQHAIHRIMGHTIPGMSGIYVEEISIKRLRAVVNHVRKKVFNRR